MLEIHSLFHRCGRKHQVKYTGYSRSYIVNNQTASLHQETDAPRLGNPRLAYGFRASPNPVIDLDDRHKRPSRPRHFPSPLLNLFSLLLSLHPRGPRLHQLLSLGLLREAFFESPPRPNTALPCLLPVICHAHCAIQLCVPQRLLVLLNLILSLHSHAYGGPPAFILLFSRALVSRLSPFSIASSPPFTPSLRCPLISRQWQLKLKRRNSLPVRIAIPACAIASPSPAPDSPIPIY
jgi:hypothetical protein